MPFTGSLPSFTALEVLPAADLQKLSDALASVAGVWTAFTPTLTNTTLGNGTLVGRYRQTGKLVDFRWKLTRGSSTSFTGAVSVTLPVTALDGNWTGSLYLFQTGTTANRTPGLMVGGTTTAELRGAAGGINGTNPWTWTTGDTIQGSATYEAA